MPAELDLTPLWQRIADGRVDLSAYSDREILSGNLLMEDGRTLPRPHVLPEVFIREQVKRGLASAERRIREGAMKALDVYEDILEDNLEEAKDRLKAGEFFLNRFLGSVPKEVRITTDVDENAAREELINRLVRARQRATTDVAMQVAQGEIVGDDVVDAEIVDDATIHLEDLL